MKIFRRRKPDPAVQPDPQCTGTTLAGRRCRLAALPGSDRRPLHTVPGPRTPAAAT